MLAEQWNGTAWPIPATANPPGVVDSSLTGVSCASSDACTAVGNGVNTSDTDVTLAGHWNGTTLLHRRRTAATARLLLEELIRQSRALRPGVRARRHSSRFVNTGVFSAVGPVIA